MVRKLCCAPGCEDVAVEGLPHCAEHAERARIKVAAQRADAKKSEAAQAGRWLYALARWKRASRAYLRRNPFCEDCAELGAVVAASQVDHKVRHMGDQRLFWDRNNWQSLCQSCHSRKTAREVWHRSDTGGG